MQNPEKNLHLQFYIAGRNMLMLFRRYFIGPGVIFVIFQEIGIFSLRFKSTKVDKGYLCITLHLLNGNNSETFKNGVF